MIQTLEPAVQEHPFFSGLSEAKLKVISGSARSVEFPTGCCIFREGDAANEFYAICDGLVSVEMLIPSLGATTVQTISKGEVLGWSWVAPPYRWHFTARSLQKTRALVFDAVCLRLECNKDHDFGYEMLKRFSNVITARLDATCLQLVDLYTRRSRACHSPTSSM